MIALPNMRPVIPVKRDKPFDDPEWLFEPKYDGFRAMAYFDGNECYLISRTGKRLPFRKLEKQIAQYLKGWVHSIIMDGEAVSMNEENRPIFRDLIRRRGNIVYIAFDIMWLDGHDLRERPLIERKKLLSRVARVNSHECIRASLWEKGIGVCLFGILRGHDLEGMIAKRLAGIYSPKTRWYKILNPTYSQVKDHRSIRMKRR